MAIRNLKQIYPNIIYVSVGYGEEEENIRKLVNELGLENHIIFQKNINNRIENNTGRFVIKSRFDRYKKINIKTLIAKKTILYFN